MMSVHKKTISWTAAADGSVADTVVDELYMKGYGFSLHSVVTDPGSPAPQDNYDITIEDADGIDILGGAGANRDTANTERALPLYGSVAAPAPLDGALTVKISGNNIPGAKGKIVLVFTS